MAKENWVYRQLELGERREEVDQQVVRGEIQCGEEGEQKGRESASQRRDTEEPFESQKGCLCNVQRCA
jgi:hypothetical protein